MKYIRNLNYIQTNKMVKNFNIELETVKIKTKRVIYNRKYTPLKCVFFHLKASPTICNIIIRSGKPVIYDLNSELSVTPGKVHPVVAMRHCIINTP